MIKKALCFLLGSAALVLLLYFLQPLKKGKGLDTATRYQLSKDWLHLPPDVTLGNPVGLGIDTGGHLVVFHRADRAWPLVGPLPGSPIKNKTILLIDSRNGKLLSSWGDNQFIMPHGLTVDGENNIWVTDVGLHQVFKFSHEGKLLLKLGEAGVAAADSLHFNQPTDVAVAEDGSFYVSDGYGNSRIVKFSAAGTYLFAWGKKGDGEGEFNVPHGIALDNRDNVYVADRENNRVQVFDRNGKFIKQYADETFGALCSVAFDRSQSKLFAVDDFAFLKLKHRGSDVFIFDTGGRVQTRAGRSGSYEGPTAWYHDLAVDKEENIYVGDILGNTVQKFIKGPNL